MIFGAGALPFVNWLPSMAGASLAAWFRLGVGVTVTGAGVSSWTDQSGNGRSLLQGTDANRPPLQADSSILFDGATQYLKCGAFALNQPSVVSMLIKQVSWTASDRLFDGNTGNVFTCLLNTASPQIRIFAGAGFNDANLSVGSYGVVSFLFNGASSSIQVNGNGPTSGDAGASNADGFTLGADFGGSNASNVQVKEVILRSTSDARVRLLDRRYLAALGGISI